MNFSKSWGFLHCKNSVHLIKYIDLMLPAGDIIRFLSLNDLKSRKQGMSSNCGKLFQNQAERIISTCNQIWLKGKYISLHIQSLKWTMNNLLRWTEFLQQFGLTAHFPTVHWDDLYSWFQRGWRLLLHWADSVNETGWICLYNAAGSLIEWNALYLVNGSTNTYTFQSAFLGGILVR